MSTKTKVKAPTIEEQLTEAARKADVARQTAFRVRLERGSAVEETLASDAATNHWYTLLLRKEGGAASP